MAETNILLGLGRGSRFCSNKENKYELLWLPGINVDKIVSQNGQSLGTLETKNYPNSEWTTVVPPPVLWQLGVVDYDDQNAPGSVGCGYYEADIGP